MLYEIFQKKFNLITIMIIIELNIFNIVQDFYKYYFWHFSYSILNCDLIIDLLIANTTSCFIQSILTCIL